MSRHMKTMSVEDRLGLLKFNANHESHIQLKLETCAQCQDRVCLYVCPGACYTLNEEEGTVQEKGVVLFNHEGCLECGTCRIACTMSSLEWEYPEGGYGVTFRFG